MVHWFGPGEHPHLPRVKTPVGELCGYCTRPISGSDSGFQMPYLTETTLSTISYHYDCLLGSILGPDWRERYGKAD